MENSQIFLFDKKNPKFYSVIIWNLNYYEKKILEWLKFLPKWVYFEQVKLYWIWKCSKYDRYIKCKK